jgi:hypothetical protein
VNEDPAGAKYAHWKQHEPGRPPSRLLVYGGIAVAVLLLGYGVVRLFAYWNDTPAPPTDPPRPATGYFRQELLRAGDCFNDRDIESAARGGTQTVGTVPAVDVISCARPHIAEVFGRVRIAESSTYPGPDAIQQAGASCDDQLAEYVGDPAAAADLSVWLLPPTPAAWERGIGLVDCVAVTAHAERRRGSVAR